MTPVYCTLITVDLIYEHGCVMERCALRHVIFFCFLWLSITHIHSAISVFINMFNFYTVRRGDTLIAVYLVRWILLCNEAL